MIVRIWLFDCDKESVLPGALLRHFDRAKFGTASSIREFSPDGFNAKPRSATAGPDWMVREGVIST
ncbi:hypothetical protein [Mesorhizobium sp.]|uniref:hypothetical protein n=1 Tax=Mesorhizobium sp. TaxID=1871066 RepID=UPI000FE879B7|nr:hypothetical protein [Mesorhizobium sp.]RWO18151.1 MAG: hypothetical protein EOS09_35975 [Mesorhizobium sp.]